MEITTVYYIGFIIIVAIVLYVVFAYYRNPNKRQQQPLVPADGTLEQQQYVLDSDNTRKYLLSPPSSTLLIYFFLKASDKTSRVEQTTNTLLEIPDVLQFNYGPNSAELVINTFNTATGQAKDEHIEISSIPQQKWVQLAILRDGRRFDVMYNDKIVASKRLEHMPVYASASLSIGGPQLRGVFRQGRVFNYRLSLQDVRDELADTSDTRQKPPTDITMTIGNPFSIFTCPGGFFCRADGRTPKNALQEWETPYA